MQAEACIVDLDEFWAEKKKRQCPGTSYQRGKAVTFPRVCYDI